MVIDERAAADGSVTLKALMSRMAEELLRTADDLKRVQSLSDGLPLGCLPDRGVVALQELDISEQTVRALAGIAASLASVAPDNFEVESSAHLSTCQMSSISNRLAGIFAPETAPFEFF